MCIRSCGLLPKPNTKPLVDKVLIVAHFFDLRVDLARLG